MVGLPLDPGRDGDRRDARRAAAGGGRARRLPPRARAAARSGRAVWEEAPAAGEWEREPVWIHGDLDRRNLLARDGRLAAVLDFGCLGVGDPACDVALAWKVLAGRAREAFLDELTVDEATRARARGWVLWQALGALSYDTLETNAPLVVEARRWLEEVLEP